MKITVNNLERTPDGQNTRGASFLRRPVLVCCRPNHDGKISPLPPRRVECKGWVWRALEELAAARDTGMGAIVDAAIKDYVIAHGARPSNAPQTPCGREDGLPHTDTPTEARTRHGRFFALLRRLWAAHARLWRGCPPKVLSADPLLRPRGEMPRKNREVNVGFDL